jgi:hypothetical protein
MNEDDRHVVYLIVIMLIVFAYGLGVGLSK